LVTSFFVYFSSVEKTSLAVIQSPTSIPIHFSLLSLFFHELRWRQESFLHLRIEIIFGQNYFASHAKGEYCAVYRLNYDYYCRGIWTGEKLVTHSRHLDRIKKFCPTYKEACVHYKEPESLEQEYRRKSYREILEELAEIIPCTPECNQNVHPHCTQECKCDYDYPRMQRFCNPPALPLFLNTCRSIRCSNATFQSLVALYSNYLNISTTCFCD
uniref:TIL domain-containing protein n=1 Tax=Heligmosomoides polygyrus TaxID=6339 RepID=A0A183FQT2_HELPZ